MAVLAAVPAAFRADLPAVALGAFREESPVGLAERPRGDWPELERAERHWR